MPEIFDSATDKKSQETKELGSQLSKERHQPKRKKRVDDYSETLRQEKPATNPVKSFAPKPKKVAFDSQMEGEEIVLMLRQHPITKLKAFILTALAIFGPFLFASVPFLDFLPARFRLAAVIGWYMILMSYILENFLTWFFNVFIITDERIIDVDFSSLIFKRVSSAKIENIEDVTVATGGVLASIVDFGTVFIQTSAEVPEIEFESVPHPNKVAKVLNELILEEEQEKLEGRVR